MGLPLPSSDTLLNPLGPINGTQVMQVSQLTISIPRERKIERYGSPDSILTHKAYQLNPSDDTQVTTKLQL